MINYWSDYFRQNKIISTNFTGGNSWVVLSSIEENIKAKIEKIGTPLKNWDINIYRGILTGYNEAFIITKDVRDRLVDADPKSDEIIRPILRGRDIEKYKANWAGLYLIATHTGYKDATGKVIPPIKINNYPSVKAHLDDYWAEISKRQDKGITPYNLRSCIYMDDFFKQKIVYSEIVQSPQFHLDNHAFFPEATTFLLTGNRLKYLIAFLNSKTVTYFYKKFYAGGGLGESGYRYKKAFLEFLPIPIPDIIIENKINILIDKIYLINNNIKNQSIENEIEIEKIVQLSYNLSDEEIKLINS